MARLTGKDWLAIRDAWETDERDGFAWVPKHLDLSVGRSAVAKRAAREGWKKKAAPEVVTVTNATPAVTPLSRSVTKETGAPGRPSEYKSEYADMAYRLMLLGFTREGLAQVFDVDERTIYRWQSDHSEFCQALWRGGAIADAEVAESLFNRAKGSVVPDCHVGFFEGAAIITKLEKHHPPDVGAARLWLTNRQPHMWKQKVEIFEQPEIKELDKEAMDRLYEKALREAAERRDALQNRGDRLGLRLDGDQSREDEVIVYDD